MQKYQVVKIEDNNTEVMFESFSTVQINTVFKSLVELYKNMPTKIKIEKLEQKIPSINQLFNNKDYVLSLRNTFINEGFVDQIIYPCIFNFGDFKNDDEASFLYFSFNRTVNNYSVFYSNGEYCSLSRYPNKEQVIKAIENGFLQLELDFKNNKISKSR